MEGSSNLLLIAQTKFVLLLAAILRPPWGLFAIGQYLQSSCDLFSLIWPCLALEHVFKRSTCVPKMASWVSFVTPQYTGVQPSSLVPLPPSLPSLPSLKASPGYRPQLRLPLYSDLAEVCVKHATVVSVTWANKLTMSSRAPNLCCLCGRPYYSCSLVISRTVLTPAHHQSHYGGSLSEHQWYV